MPCVQCCRCQSTEVVRSRWRFNATDLWTAATLRRPFRCTACLHRFVGWSAPAGKSIRGRDRWRKPTRSLQTATLVLACAFLVASASRAEVVITNQNATPTSGAALSTTGNSNSNRITFTPGQQGLYQLVLGLKLFNNSNANSDKITSATLNFSSVGSIGSSTALGLVTSNALNITKNTYGNAFFNLGEFDLGPGGAEIVFTLSSVLGGTSTTNTFWAAGGGAYSDPSTAYPGWVNVTPTTAIGASANGFQWELQAVHAPEPGTLLLGLIASSAGGGAVWWKRRKKPQAPPANGLDEPTPV